MRLVFSEEQEKFRQEVRGVVEAELKAGNFSPDIAGLVGGPSQDFSRKMAEHGWIGMTWPKQYGGQEKTYVEKMIMLEEMMRVKAPVGYHFSADRQVGPALMKFGSDWQKDHFLPRIIKAEDGIQFCLLFSEPDAGSDLAAVSTTAREDGDFYVIDGQKVWTSGGHIADYGWLLARTTLDSNVRGHMACSEFILDMKSPGVTVRPINNIAGSHSFNEVFMDNVRVHKKYLVGKENEGWAELMTALSFERGTAIAFTASARRRFEHLVQYAKETGLMKKASVRSKLADLAIDIESARLMAYEPVWKAENGISGIHEPSRDKAAGDILSEKLTRIGTEMIGAYAQLDILHKDSKWTKIQGALEHLFYYCPGLAVAAGTTAVQKNIVAQFGLQLPKSY